MITDSALSKVFLRWGTGPNGRRARTYIYGYDDDFVAGDGGGEPVQSRQRYGLCDIKADKDAAPEFSLEYHDDTQLGWFKPFLHASYVTNGMTFLGAGLLVDLQVGDNWIVQPSLAATWWRGGTEKLDLGYPLIFRSRLEVAYRFKDKSRLGLAFTHSSNAHLDEQNPGSETLMLNVSVPLTLFAF